MKSRHPGLRIRQSLKSWLLCVRSKRSLGYALALLVIAIRVAHADDSDDADSGASTFEIWKFVLSIGGYVGALIAFVLGLRQYARADYWKRSEFVAREMKEFFADRQVGL